MTYRELASLQNRAGNVLLGLGVRPEDRVLLALSDGPEFVACWYAALKVGAVVAEAYTFLPAKDYAYYLSYTRARVVDRGRDDARTRARGRARACAARRRSSSSASRGWAG